MIDKSKLYGIAIALIAIIAAGLAGAWLGYDYAAAKGKAELSKLETAHATALAKATSNALEKYQAETERGNRAERALLEAKQRFAAEKQALQRRINDVTTIYQPMPGAALVAIPRAVYTAGFLYYYNAAIGVPGNQAAAIAGIPGAEADKAGTDNAWLRESGLATADILYHVGFYGEYCQGLAAQVNGLLDEREGDK